MSELAPPQTPDGSQPHPVPPGPPPEDRPEKIRLPALLFAVTFVTTTLAGFFLHIRIGGGTVDAWRVLADPTLLALGLPFSISLMLILLAHEMGHYLACRYYGIRATLPYFIPAPPFPFGTFGAIIRIRSPFLTSRQLFDVGVAGPLAGMALVVPAAAIGLALSQPAAGEPLAGPGFVIGFPLLFKGLVLLLHEGGRLETIHGVACAAWFGSLATSFNLIPIGQLDGGHLSLSLFGPRAHYRLSQLFWGGLLAAGLFWFPGYLLVGVILAFLGFRHPSPLFPDRRLGGPRVLLALLALIVFILTLVPVPLKMVMDLSTGF